MIQDTILNYPIPKWLFWGILDLFLGLLIYKIYKIRKVKREKGK